MAVTARVEWTAIDFHAKIEYDDATRQITTTATGGATPVFDLQTVQVTPTVSRTIAYYPQAGGAVAQRCACGGDGRRGLSGDSGRLSFCARDEYHARAAAADCSKTAGGVDGMLSGGQWSTF
jgi:hypothetical protein